MAETRSCPICKRPAPDTGAERKQPFCSKRCADIDLLRWLNGVYAIPAGAMDDADDSELPDAEAGGTVPPESEVRH